MLHKIIIINVVHSAAVMPLTQQSDSVKLLTYSIRWFVHNPASSSGIMAQLVYSMNGFHGSFTLCAWLRREKIGLETMSLV